MEGLTIDLFGPGMGPLHRAGLGGLAATVRWLNDARGGGRASPELRPEGVASYGRRAVTLSWARPEDAASFLRRLYGLAFGLRGGCIHLPAACDGIEQRADVAAALQDGTLRTILQHNKSRKKAGPAKWGQYEVDGRIVRYLRHDLEDYMHRSAWRSLVFDKKGTLRPWVDVKGTIAPGFMVRHEKFHARTVLRQGPGHAIALHFALIGTLSLSLAGADGTLVVPDVDDLEAFAERRSWLTPLEPKDCRVGGPADAALQAMVRLRAAREGRFLGVRRCLAVLFKAHPWTGDQKTRAAVLSVEADDQALGRFASAMATLPPRVVPSKSADAGDGVSFASWADSVVRPLVADNLARGRPWFEGFRGLLVGAHGRIDEARAAKLGYEKEGLNRMIDEPWEDRGEERIVRAVHDAMRRAFTAIWRQEGVGSVAKGNRTHRQMVRWRLAFAGARTPDDVRNALTDMWSRSTPNPTLKAGWASMLPLLCDERRWKLNRDLALLALASYAGLEDAPPAGDDAAEVVDDDA